ncbi:hypothetical protein [Malikia spinosa]|uniref:Uncharacterized protein n=1 Tax=Malikia spinosa TaxID=86180 RepID=A0A7C9NF13_9BURK|nr:hypothetical protein [Malikia spinosa]MYZ51183.1 hypothetical protein [Malikia spinosa]
MTPARWGRACSNVCGAAGRWSSLAGWPTLLVRVFLVELLRLVRIVVAAGGLRQQVGRKLGRQPASAPAWPG